MEQLVLHSDPGMVLVSGIVGSDLLVMMLDLLGERVSRTALLLILIIVVLLVTHGGR